MSSTAVEGAGHGARAAGVLRWAADCYATTIGKKVVMALTGVVFVGYVVLHVMGNLLIFQGPEAINGYAVTLRKMPAVLWGARFVLLGSLLLHVHAALALTRVNRLARPSGYEQYARASSTWAARSLRVGGVILLVFVIYHILHFTTGTVHPDFEHLAVYRNVVVAFRNPWVVGFYLVALLALGLHLAHGGWSLLRTLGAGHPRFDPVRRTIALLLAVLIPAGFALVPLAVVLGLLR